MRVLLDECLPRRLTRSIEGHEATTVQEAGWAGKSNGELLALAGESFDVFITVDLNLPAQQNLGSGIAVITLAAPTNRLQDLEPLVPALLVALSTIRKGQLVRLGG
jgi:predicted nuclease of predicted toxin-antitoxin system